MALYFLLSLLLALLTNRYFRFRFHQLPLSFTFFTYIPTYFLDKMHNYYA